MKRTSIVYPCFNEDDIIETCNETVKAIFDRDLYGDKRKYIFVDHASSDRTVENLRENAAKDPRLCVVVNSRNFGVFRSKLNWLRYATGDAILCMPPVDPQDPPEHLPESVRLWESGYDVAAGARSTRGENLALRTSRKMFYRIFNSLSDFDLSPDLREFQLSDHKVLKAVLSHNDHYPYIRGIIASAGFKKVIIPYTWKARKRGVSKHNLIMMIDHALNAIFAFTKVSVKAVTGSRNVASLALHKA